MGFFTDTIGLHRLQGVRGRVQGMEPRPRGRAGVDRRVATTTPPRSARTRWRHVAFIEQREPLQLDGRHRRRGRTRLRWLMSSDVCKHCTHAACLDVCPTGALFRTEFGTVVVQEDVCNGCGYCVPACPFGVIDKRHLPPTDPSPDLPRVRQERGRQGLEVHALLRPAERRTRAGVREGVPDRLDPVRRARRVARARRRAAREATGGGLERRAALRPRSRRRRRRLRRLLPAAGRARGLRPAARPGRNDARPAASSGARRRSRPARVRRRRRGRVPRRRR